MQRHDSMPSRRAILGGAAGAAAMDASPLTGKPLKSRSDPRFGGYRDRALGCWFGAAIGDALGGPVEVQHYKRIEKYYGDFRDLLPYRKPPGLIGIGPGYAKHSAAGSITDDTYIRADLARYFLSSRPPHSPERLAAYLLKHADFSNWWEPAAEVLRRVGRGEASAEDAGLTHRQGGGGGWWQPVAMMHGGNPEGAGELTASLCRLWKGPFERNVLAAVVAGQAAAFRPGATIDSVVETVLWTCGPLARKLFERAVEVARAARGARQLYEGLYAQCLVNAPVPAVDGPMPPPVTPKAYVEGAYSSVLFAEQQPWALAYLVFGKGDPAHTVLTAVKGGRDADSIATNTASWLGALVGEEAWPRKWRDAVERENLVDFDLRKTGEELVDAGLRDGTVMS